MSKRRKEKPRSDELREQISVRVQPDYDNPFPSAYANFAAVSHTPFEVCIDFCTIAPPNRHDAEKKILYAPVTVRVMIQPGMIEGLINALQVQLDRFRSLTGEMSIEIPEKV